MNDSMTKAEFLIYFLRKIVSNKVKLIGSLSKGKKQSKHDIDVLIPKRKTIQLKKQLKYYLEPKSIKDTDWGGWYFYDTFFGDVDVFFTTKDFDY